MLPPGFDLELKRDFEDPDVVRAYRHRAPYADEIVGAILARLDPGRSRVLDVGCGLGELSRRLARGALAVDALDRSPAMLAAATPAPGVTFILGELETADLEGPYDLVVAGESLHWLDLPRALPRLRALLAPGGALVALATVLAQTEQGRALRAIGRALSTCREYVEYDPIAVAHDAGLLVVEETQWSAPFPHRQPIDDAIESVHSRTGFTRSAMSAAHAAALDAELRAFFERCATDGVVTHQMATWMARCRVV